MNLTKEKVEKLRVCALDKTLCDGWLAMWEMLSEVRWDKLLCCIECGAPRGHGCGPDCKINELMG